MTLWHYETLGYFIQTGWCIYDLSLTLETVFPVNNKNSLLFHMRCKPWNIGGKCIATKDMRKLRIYIYFLSVSDICHFPIASLAKRYNTRHDTNSSIAEKFPLTPVFFVGYWWICPILFTWYCFQWTVTCILPF